MVDRHAVAEEPVHSDDPRDPGGVEGAGDDPEMADRDVGAFDEISRGRHSNGFSGKYKDLAV